MKNIKRKEIMIQIGHINEKMRFNNGQQYTMIHNKQSKQKIDIVSLKEQV